MVFFFFFFWRGKADVFVNVGLILPLFHLVQRRSDTTFPYYSSKQWKQDMLECVKHGFQVCRCPAHSQTYTPRPTGTCALQLFRYAESTEAVHVPSARPFSFINTHTHKKKSKKNNLFLSYFSVSFHGAFPSYFPHCSGWRIQLPVVALAVFDGVL